MCNFYDMLHTVIVIDTSYNNIKTLEKNCFHNVHQLVCIMLQYNAIVHVKNKSFNNLTRLNYVNLSNNPISHLSSNIIFQSCQVITISLKHNFLIDIHKYAFSWLNIKMVETNNYRLCCIIPFDVECYRPWYKSCNHLLSMLSTKVTFIIISVLIIFANTLSVIIHIKSMGISDTFNKTL